MWVLFSGRKSQGFLLIEALVSLALFISMVTIIAQYHAYSLQQYHDAMMRIKVMNVITSCIESCISAQQLPLSRYEDQEIEIVTDTQLMHDESMPSLHQITMTAYWRTASGQQKSCAIVTMMHV